MDQGCHFRSLSDLCCSVAKSCPALCDPMDCSTSGFLVLHYLYFKLCLIQPFSGIDVPREWVQGWGLPAGHPGAQQAARLQGGAGWGQASEPRLQPSLGPPQGLLWASCCLSIHWLFNQSA